MDLILGTAGHIDHGKTSLVAQLTGIDCDRLEEEKRRGITIELGFAWLDLPNGGRVGIVDVPGHERFVKNMVAGASGVDCVLLVIAADEGVMAQTREHLEICSLLGIRTGLVALTKIDLVDQDWLDMVREDIASVLKGTFLENSPLLPVSSVTGEGMEALKKEIAKMLSGLAVSPKADIFRLPVDRVFTMKGFGTVATGTIISGACSQGERLCVMPSGKISRARSLEVHNKPVETARQGQRCAINLQNLEVSDLVRGNVIAKPDSLFPSHSWFVRLNCLKSARLPIRQRMEVHFHHGTAECLAKIVFLDRDQLEPGQSAIAEVRFTDPMSAIYGDRCVLRSQSPLRAIGGGIVINPIPPVMRRRRPDYAEKARILQELGAPDKDNQSELAFIEPLKLVELALSLYPAPGLSLAQIQVLTALSKICLVQTLEKLSSRGQAYCLDSVAGYWIGNTVLNDCLEKCEQRLRELHKREPLKGSFAATALIVGWGENLPDKAIQSILELGVERGVLAQAGTGYKLAAHEFRLDKDSEKMRDILLKKIITGNRTPPFIREILEEQNWDAKKAQPILKYLCECGEIIKIQDGVYYSPEAFAEMTEKIRQWFDTHDDLEIGDIKPLLGISRKYAIPFMEYLDSIRFTSRVGNQRRLIKAVRP